MVHFVGAGPGAPDLITVRGKKLIEKADAIVYAGSLVNPELLSLAKDGCRVHDSAGMTLDEIVDVLKEAEESGLCSVRLHSGDPSLFGAIREQMDKLKALSINYDICPGVSSFCAAAASLREEFTVPGLSQTVIISRAAGRTKVPERESLAALASHGATMVLFLSAGMAGKVSSDLAEGGMRPDTPAALVYKASWPDERVVRGTLQTLPALSEKSGVKNTALIIVGDFMGEAREVSRLYAPDFSTGFRRAKP